MLFSEVLHSWWIGNQLSLNEITKINKWKTIEKHILPWFRTVELDEIDDVLINKFITHEKENGNRLTGEGLCENSIIKEIGIVKSVIDYAIIKNYIAFNPCELIPKLKRSKSREYDIFTFEEVHELIRAARPKWLGDMILLVYNTGLRKCECFGLQWGDIDFDNKLLVVKRSVTATKPNERLIGEPKTSTSKRIVLLDDATIDMLQRRFKNRTSDIWVFASKYGDLLSPWYLVKYFDETRKKVGIEGKRFYDLRHTHITELVASGVSLAIIQKRAGHSDIKMTMHYTHIKPDMQQEIINLLNNRNKQ